ncbi:MAG TPA: energy transducer TonB [bacterium]|nr:energy transducer TonB [bacterium]
MKDRSYSVNCGRNGREAATGALVLHRMDGQHEARFFGAALMMAVLLHAGLVLCFSRSHTAPGPNPGPAVVQNPNVEFNDVNQVEQPVDPSYRPEVAQVLPEVAPNQTANGPAIPDRSQGKIDPNVIDVNPGGVGPTLIIGNNQVSIESLLVGEKYAANGVRTIIGVRTRVPPVAVPWVKVEVKPQPVSIPVPAYPEVVRVAGIEGRVVVQALIDTDGSVAAVQMLASSGNALLDAASCEAAQGAKFTPARERDKPVAVWVSIPFQFHLH